jgi:hypothetical protein
VVARLRRAAADALANGVALRTAGLLEDWRAQLRVYPEALAAARIEEAALAWGGFHPTGFLTLYHDLRAMLVMSELQAETADLAPSGPNVDRARRWLREVIAVLREASDSRTI